MRQQMGYAAAVADAFDRLIEQRAFDLTGRAAQSVQVTSYAWSEFNQLRAWSNTLGETVRHEYDQAGNLIAETDARGFTERYVYSAENRLIQRSDRLGGR